MVHGSATPNGRGSIAEAMAAAGNRYRIRRVFRSNRSGMGPFLGRQVPALICYDGNRPVDVFPHEDRNGVLATIADYLAFDSSGS